MREAFNAAYWAAQPLEVRQLADMEPFSSERLAKACELAEKFPIDGEIMARGMSAWETMKLRRIYGYTWVPSLLQEPIPLAPGLEVPGMRPYDPARPPAGSISVSDDINSYPAFDHAPEPTPFQVEAKPWFEADWGLGRRGVRPGDTSPGGTRYSDGGTVWVKVVRPVGPFVQAWWEPTRAA